MKYIKSILLCFFILALFFTPSVSAFADIIDSSSTLMKVYLEKDGEPYNRPVKFNVTCYGHNFSDKSKDNDIFISKQIFSFSDVYHHYPYSHINKYYGRGLRIDYCMIEGELETGEKFTIKYPDLLEGEACSRIISGSEESYEFLGGDRGQKCDLRFDISNKTPLIKRNGVSRIASPIYETRFLIALMMTIFIEVIVLLLFIKCIYKLKEHGYSGIIFTGVLASMLTLPYIWFVLPIYIKYYILAGELFAIFTEAGIYYGLFGLKLFRALLLSVVANMISFLAGLILFS